jgi:hypothetical protein
MTPEKLELLRDWIRAEIQYQIDESKIDPDSCAFISTDYIDKLFFEVLQAFCGTD